MRRPLPCILLALTLLSPRAALGQPDTAEKLFREGRQAVTMGDFTRGLDLFRMSYRLNDNPAALLNIAHCEEQLGKLIAAWKHFRDMAARLPANDVRAAIARERAAALEARIPRLRIDLAPGSPLGTTVTLDETRLAAAQLGAEWPVDPGTHIIVVSAPGREDHKTSQMIAEGMQKTMIVSPGSPKEQRAPETTPVRPPPTPDTTRPGPPTGQGDTIGWIVLGAGGVVMVLGGTFLGLSAIDVDEHDEYQAKYQATPRADYANAANDAADRANTKLWIGGIALGAGALTAGAGTYLVTSMLEETGEMSVSIAPAANGLKLEVMGRF